jgi:hypothetical protein
MSNPNTSSQKGNPRKVAVEMLSQVYEQMTEKDLSKDEFINEALEALGTNKSKPKSNLILPPGV